MAYRFIKIKDPDNHFEVSDIQFDVETVDLSEVIEQFSRFLLACGFVFEGELEIVKEESNTTETEY